MNDFKMIEIFNNRICSITEDLMNIDNVEINTKLHALWNYSDMIDTIVKAHDLGHKTVHPRRRHH